MLLPKLAILSLALFCTVKADDDISCRDQNGKPVDWFYVYKLPVIKDYCATCAHVSEGLGYLYLDSNNQQWNLSEHSLHEENQALAYTLNQMYKRWNDKPNLHILYNDQTPEGCGTKDSGYRGHTKGALYFEQKVGFWLIHSVPRFAHHEHYEYPESGTRNGQSMICISFNTTMLPEIGHQLFYMQPNMYRKGNGLNIDSEYLRQVLSRKSVRRSPYSRQAILKSRRNAQFTHFAKHRNWKKDLYADLVKSSLNTSLYVETWLNGNAADLLSECDINHAEVHNLREVRPRGIPFMSSKDHSKWAVSGEEKRPWTCIGDINRQTSQTKRAGGTMCRRDPSIWSAYSQSTSTTETCDGKGTEAVPANMLQPAQCSCNPFQ